MAYENGGIAAHRNQQLATDSTDYKNYTAGPAGSHPWLASGHCVILAIPVSGLISHAGEACVTERVLATQSGPGLSNFEMIHADKIDESVSLPGWYCCGGSRFPGDTGTRVRDT
jgi:hypothetical protein